MRWDSAALVCITGCAMRIRDIAREALELDDGVRVSLAHSNTEEEVTGFLKAPNSIASS